MEALFLAVLRSFKNFSLACAVSAFIPFAASAQFTSFFYFPSTAAQPVGAPVLVNGVLYGASYSGSGGSPACTTGKNCGTFFQLNKPSAHGGVWTQTLLYQFKGNADGAAPDANPIYFNGNFYGTTYGGGSGQGTVYVMVPNGTGGYTHSVIYTFGAGTDGSRPTYLTTLNGNLYGITSAGGANGNGTVFQLTGSGTSWTESIIHNFSSAVDGAVPEYILTFNNLLYISLAQGGAGNGGTVVQLTPPVSGANWPEDVIYAFGSTGTAAFSPQGFAFNPTDGNLYGVQQVGGGGACTFKTYTGCGGVFKLTNQNRPIAWKFLQLITFTGGADGDAPFGAPTFDAAGNLWVTTTGLATSPSSSGAVLEVYHQASGWVDNVIHTFTGTDGDDPSGALTLNPANANMYGYTVHGGKSGYGSAFAVTTAATTMTE